MTQSATIGHNNPPDPLDAALAPYGDFIAEAEGWLDGEPVGDKASMDAVDALAKAIKAARKDVTAAQKYEAGPLHDAWKKALARYKPTIDDLDGIAKGLAAISDTFKRKLADEKAAAERKAWDEAKAKRLEAEKAASEANAGNIEEQRAAEQAKIDAMEAEKAAQAAKKDTASVKGLRTVTLYEVTDYRDLINWIAKYDKDALAAFADEWARKNHKPNPQASGLRVWTEKQAF